MARAQERFADDGLVEALRTLPDDLYDSAGQVWEALKANSSRDLRQDPRAFRGDLPQERMVSALGRSGGR